MGRVSMSNFQMSTTTTTLSRAWGLLRNAPSLLTGVVTGICIAYAWLVWQPRRIKPPPNRKNVQTQARVPGIVSGIAETVGKTPLIRIRSLSEATGCEILAKAEMLNPGGSSKDRVAIAIIEHAERLGLLVPGRGDVLCEGTVGSTGISLTTIARSKGYRCHICIPSDVAVEKSQLLERLGAEVERVPPVSIVDPGHFVRVARRRAEEINQAAEASDDPSRSPHAIFCDQFENLANLHAHLSTTGPEIYEQTRGTNIDALVLGAGTGGTIAGCARYLKPRVPGLKVVLADPQGSGLYHRVKHGVMFSSLEREGSRRRHQVDTIVEGVGITRLTRNMASALEANALAAFRSAELRQDGAAAAFDDPPPPPVDADWTKWIDDAIRVSDQEAVAMSRHLVQEDGLFVGSSSAVNCVAAVCLARMIGPGKVIVTMLCDGGQRHLTKFWNDEFLETRGLSASAKVDLFA